MEQGEGGNLVDYQSETVYEASVLVSCISCGRLHREEQPLDSNPVCPTCAASYPMGLLEMNGSYPLNHETIDERVTRTSPGNYALGYMDGTTFMVFYIGRADSDLRRCLHQWVGVPSRYKRYTPSAKAACGSRHRGPLPLEAPALDRVGVCVDSSYTRFAFSYAPSAEAAFEKECRNYHAFGGSDGLDNEDHPAPAPDSSWECPERD